MPDPSPHAIEAGPWADLRSRAALRLTGAAASKGPAARAADALAVLHALACAPSTAPQALTLLHELQVHQVELELQAQELQESRAELEVALRRQTELYDRQPVGCFTIDHRFVLHEMNRTGAAMLGLARDDAQGLPLDAFVGKEDAQRLRSAISDLDAGVPQPSWLLRLCPRDGPARPVMASIGADAVPKRYLLSFGNVADERRPTAS